jgi:hypothetical protein
MAYSEDYRRRAIEYYETHTQKELYRLTNKYFTKKQDGNHRQCENWV